MKRPTLTRRHPSTALAHIDWHARKWNRKTVDERKDKLRRLKYPRRASKLLACFQWEALDELTRKILTATHDAEQAFGNRLRNIARKAKWARNAAPAAPRELATSPTNREASSPHRRSSSPKHSPEQLQAGTCPHGSHAPLPGNPG